MSGHCNSFEDGLSVDFSDGYLIFKLDELTARRQLESPQSLSSRFLHLTLVTKCSVMVMNDWITSLLFNVNWPSHFQDMAISKFVLENLWLRPCMWSKVKVRLLALQPIHLLAFHFTPISSAIPEIQLFKIRPWKSKVKVMAKVKHWSYFRPWVQSICLLL